MAARTCSWPGCGIRISRGEHCKKHAEAVRKQVIKAGEKISREEILRRDKSICGICKKKITDKWHVDHCVPIARGGKHVKENVQAAHPACNQKKGSKWPFSL